MGFNEVEEMGAWVFGGDPLLADPLEIQPAKGVYVPLASNLLRLLPCGRIKRLSADYQGCFFLCRGALAAPDQHRAAV